MKKLITAFTFFIGSLFSFDRFFDISLTTDFANLKEYSHVDLNSEVAFPFSNRAVLLNPRLSIFFDGTMDASVAAGLRHEFKYGTLGHHVFWDSSGTKEAHFHQIGHSLDFLTPRFDFRLNYYHPITKEQSSKKYLFSPHKWMEAETIWKNRFCQIGIGPKYNLFNQEWGSQARLVVPFKFFSIGGLVGYEKSKGISGCVSLSFRLFSTPRTSLLQAPICHRSRVQYSKQVIYVPPPVIPKREEPLKAEQQPKPQSVVVKPASDPSQLESVVQPPPPPPKHWWNFFFPQNKVTPAT